MPLFYSQPEDFFYLLFYFYFLFTFIYNNGPIILFYTFDQFGDRKPSSTNVVGWTQCSNLQDKFLDLWVLFLFGFGEGIKGRKQGCCAKYLLYHLNFFVFFFQMIFSVE